MQVFIEIPYSEAVFDIIAVYSKAENDYEQGLITSGELDSAYSNYIAKRNWQFREDAQIWVNKYLIEGTNVKSPECTGNETVQFEIEVN